MDYHGFSSLYLLYAIYYPLLRGSTYQVRLTPSKGASALKLPSPRELRHNAAVNVMRGDVRRAAGADKDADKKGCLIKSLIKIKEMYKNKEKSIKTDTKLDSPRGANGFRAEIADRDPKAYLHTSRGSERR